MNRSAESIIRAPADNPRRHRGQRPPVILQVLPALGTGGVERGAVDIAQAIVTAGGVSIVAARPGRLAPDLTASGTTHLDLPMHTKNPLAMMRNVRRLERVILSYGVDLVHARSRAPAWSARVAARRAGVPWVTTFHGLYGSGTALKRRYNSIMASGDRVIAVSRFMADHIRETYAVNPQRIRVIHRGVDLSLFDPAAASPSRVAALRAAWGVPPDDRVVLLPGRLTDWKGQLVLLDAMARPRLESTSIVLVGPAPAGSGFRQRIEQRATTLGLTRALRIVGDCDDMPAAYAAADVVVNASTSPEAFGRVMAEASAMGRPLVAFAHGAAPEIVDHGKTGWLVPPLNVDALARSIGEALDLNLEARHRLSAAARRKVSAALGNDRMADLTLSVYEELLLRAFPNRPGE